MSNLSLTEFVDISAVTAGQKVTKIKAAKARHSQPYTPASDFYKPLREAIIEIHQKGKSNGDLSKVLIGISDKKKRTNYPAAIAGYKKWWGKKSFTWFDPSRTEWSAHGLSVAVNPELGLEIKGVPHLIKLYFKAEPLAKAKVDIILQLMQQELAPHSKKGVVMSILDVRRSKLVVPTVQNSALSIALDAEMAFIATVWPSV